MRDLQVRIDCAEVTGATLPQTGVRSWSNTSQPPARNPVGRAAGVGPYRDVDDLAVVLDRFDIDRAALVGLSMGGETALDFALPRTESNSGTTTARSRRSSPAKINSTYD
jgi:pimeloyl-ACP methyl ester carboxylesterase